MLRAGPFSLVERCVAWAMGGLTIAAGLVGLVLTVERGAWLPGLCALGVVALGLLYARAAWLGRPLVLAGLRQGPRATPGARDDRNRP